MSEFRGTMSVMRRVERLYAIHERLRRAAPATVSARVLADELGVTRRTIERDLATLRLAGAPIYGQVGRRGGTASVARADRSIVTLGHTEIVALIVAARLAGTAPFSPSATTAIDKLLAVLGDHERAALEQLRDRFRVATPPDVSGTTRVRTVIEDSVRDQTVARISYLDRHQQTTTRRIEPVGFYQADGVWSVVAWCQLRDAGRLFLLPRITSAHRTTRRFASRDIDDVLGWVPTPGHRP
jgi:predicted DNA-binding transcriptional regulator YafY